MTNQWRRFLWPYRLALIIIDCYRLSSIAIDCHLLLSIIFFYLLSQRSFCMKFYDSVIFPKYKKEIAMPDSTILQITDCIFIINVTFHGKTYTNGFPLNGWNEQVTNGSASRLKRLTKPFERLIKNFKQVAKPFKGMMENFEQVPKPFERLLKTFERVSKPFKQLMKLSNC